MAGILYFFLVSGLFISSTSAATDPVLSPVNVTDANGNFADTESNITWAPLPAGIPYATTGAEPDGFLEPYLDLMRGFTNILQPKDIDFELVTGIYNKSTELSKGAKDIGMFMIGFGICVVIGFLFLLIFPIVGCCFCCCRLCGNCGGKRIQKEPKDCKCVAFTVVMDILVAGQLMGALLLMMVSDRMGYSLGYLGNATESNLNDMTVFLNNTQGQVSFVVSDGFNFTRDVIVRDLDSRGYILGVKVRDDLLNYLNLNEFMTNIQTMETKVNDVYNAFTNLDYANSNFTNTYTALETALNTIRGELGDGNHFGSGDCTGDCNTLYTNTYPNLVINAAADPSNVPSLTDSLTSLQSLKNQNISETAQNGMKTFQDIPWTIQNDTQSEVDKIKSQLDSFIGTIDKNLESMNTLSGSTGSIGGIQKDIKKYTSYLTDYDSYRSAAFWGFAFLTLICPILWLFGICIGPCCYNGKTSPKERPCCSNCAGIFLMAGAGCAWMLSLLIMLFTLLPFLIGYPLEKILCDTITDPEYKAFKYIFDGPGSMLKSDGYFLSEMIFQNKSINLTVSGVLESCKNNETAYEALKLSNLIDLDQITDYSSQINLTEQLNNMQTNFSNVELMSQTTEDQLREFSNASNVNFTAFNQIYTQSLLNTDLQAFITDLKNVADGLGGFPALQSNLNDKVNDLNNLLNAQYNAAAQDQAYCLSNTTEAENQAGTIPTVVNNTIDSANAAEQRLQNGSIGNIFTNAILAYQERLFKVINSYVSYILNNFKHEMGKCMPIWNLWDSLILTGLCSLTVDSFNAFWFTLGMSLFCSFLSIIFSIKLAKFFRRMKYDENDENPQNADNKNGDEPEVVDNDNAYNSNGGMPMKNNPGPDPFVSASRPGPEGVSKNMGFSPPPPY